MEIDMTESTSRFHKMTDAIRTEILRLWGEGYSGGQIAAALGITRNSVIGVSYRARQSGFIRKKVKVKKEEKTPKPKIKKEKVVKPKPTPKPEIVEYFRDVLENCTIDTLRYNSCRFIVEEGNYETTKYCGKEAEKCSYCAYHYKICYFPAKTAIEKLANNK
jgi:hypothetical protein